MVRLTRLNQIPMVVNAELIEHIEMTPDTVITLTTGQKCMVRETTDEVVERVIQYRRSVLNGLPHVGTRPSEPEDIPAMEAFSRASTHGK